MRRAMLVGSLAAALLGAPASAATLEEFTVEDWSGLALSDDATGRLASCAIYSKYQNGATLFFIHHVDGNWTLSLVHDSWALDQETEYPVRTKVDRDSFVDAAAVALDKDQIGVALSADDTLIAQIRRGKLLTVVFQGKEYGFELSNSRKAMDGARECIERHRGTVGPVVQQGAPGAEAAQEAPTEAAGPGDGADPAEAAEASATGERQTFGPWVVTATDDGAGKFVNCTAFGIHGDDQLIMSYRPDDVWEFGLYRAAWALDVNQTYYLWYNVDAPAEGSGVIKRPVEAVEPTRIFFEVSGEEDIIARMEGGRTLNLQLRGVAMEPQSFSYSLDAIGPAFAAARECTRQNVEAARQAEIAEPPPSLPPADESEPAKTLPVLGEVKIEDFEVPGWEGAAFSDAAGAFTHCAIQAEYQNGATLALLRTAAGPLLLTLRRDDWSLEPSAWVPLEYLLAGTEPATVSSEAMALDAFVLAVDLGVDTTVPAQLRGAAELSVKTREKSLSFDISDVGPGLDAIESCVERHGAPAASGPLSPETPSQKIDPGTATPPVPEAEPEVPSGGPDSPELEL